MRTAAIASALLAVVVAACGARPHAAAAPLGNAGTPPAAAAPAHGFVVTAVDRTGGAREARLQAAAQHHADALAHARDVDALHLEVALVALDRSAKLTCKVVITVSTAADQAIVGQISSGASVDSTDDAAADDCVDTVVGDMVDRMVGKLVDDRVAAQAGAAPAGAATP